MPQDSADSPLRLALKNGPILVELKRESISLGRDINCDIVLQGSTVSRQHARIIQREGQSYIEDLGSRNGVFVDGEAVKGQVLLRLGHTVQLGDHSLDVVRSKDRSAHTAFQVEQSSRQTLSGTDPAEETTAADALSLLTGVVDKQLAMGRFAEAERLLRPRLLATLIQMEKGEKLSDERLHLLVEYALKLAEGTRNAEWLDYVISVYHHEARLLPAPLVDRFYLLVHRVRGINIPHLKAYVSALQARHSNLSPGEQFVLKRILGLERLALA